MTVASTGFRVRQVLDAVSGSPAPVLVVRLGTRVVVVASPRAHELLTAPGQPLAGRSLDDLLAGDDSAALALLAAGRITGYESRRVARLAGRTWRVRVRALGDAEPVGAAVVVLIEDDPARADAAWAEDAPPAVVGSIDTRLTVDRISGEVLESLGRRVDGVAGRSFLELIARDSVGDVLAALARACRHRVGVTLPVGVLGADGVPVPRRLVLLPFGPPPSCAFALLGADPDGAPGAAGEVADLIARLGRAQPEPAAGSAPPPPAVDLGHLSGRELEIVTRLMAGDRVASIARVLFLAEGTVRNHLSSAFGKLGVRTQRELIDLLRPAAVDRDE